MSNTKIGGQKVKLTNTSKYGADYYKRIGALGGKAKGAKGFAVSGLASSAGKVGGKLGRRGVNNARRSKENLKEDKSL